MRSVLVIVGSTGSGKSEVAQMVARALDGEIISADSVQVFRGYDIGSAKVKKAEMQVPHHLIDICDGNELFTASDFVRLASAKIDEIFARGKQPIIVGGTGLYVKALVLGYNFGGGSGDQNLRQQLISLDGEALQNMARSLGVQEDIPAGNKKRLVRAIEIAKSGGQKTWAKAKENYKIFALDLPREVLYAKINARTDQMIASGLVSEVKSLLKTGQREDNQPMSAIGYKETVAFLKGILSEEEMREKIKQHTRNYAKRQLTFLRSFEGVEYIDAQDKNFAAQQIIKKFLPENCKKT